MRAPWPGRRLALRTGNVYLGTPDRWETITETTVHEGLNGKEASTTRRRVFVPGRDGADHPASMTFRQPADLDVFLRFLPVVGTVMSIAEGDLEGAILGLAGDFLWGLGALAKAGRAANLARAAHGADAVADAAPLLRTGTRLPLNMVDDGARTLAPATSNQTIRRILVEGVTDPVENFVARDVGRIIATDPVASRAYSQLQRSGTNVILDFGEPLDAVTAGLTRPGEVIVFMRNAPSARAAVATIMHESSHVRQLELKIQRYFHNTQYNEYRCFRREFLFNHGRRPNIVERTEISDLVRQLYPELPPGRPIP